MKRGEPNSERRCVNNCGRIIEECMGFCLSRDMWRLWNGEHISEVRELCGHCVLVVDPYTIPWRPDEAHVPGFDPTFMEVEIV